MGSISPYESLLTPLLISVPGFTFRAGVFILPFNQQLEVYAHLLIKKIRTRSDLLQQRHLCHGLFYSRTQKITLQSWRVWIFRIMKVLQLHFIRWRHFCLLKNVKELSINRELFYLLVFWKQSIYIKGNYLRLKVTWNLGSSSWLYRLIWFKTSSFIISSLTSNSVFLSFCFKMRM